MVKEQKSSIIVNVIDPKKKEIFRDSFEEFRLLVETLSYEIVAETLYTIREPHYATFLGKGKIEELKNLVKLTEASIIFVDSTLTFLQLRNLSKEIGVPVVDRPHLILMIFSFRAKTLEAKLQVELSQLKMRLPEIVHSDVDLDQQTGSMLGLKGAGERKTEIKRRYIENRIKVLENKLEEIKKHRFEVRKKRKKGNIPIVSIVGYTNAGKSTLLNILTASNALVEDKLFATLDTLARVGDIKEGLTAIFVDTIGFISNLPPQLVYSFRSTLEEILDSWLIIHVIDVSDSQFRTKMDVVLETLNDLGVHDIPIITVFNKIDLVDQNTIQYLQKSFPSAVFISALKNVGIDKLKDTIFMALKDLVITSKIFIPFSKLYLLDEIYNSMHVISRKDTEEGIILFVEGYLNNVYKYKEFFANKF